MPQESGPAVANPPASSARDSRGRPRPSQWLRIRRELTGYFLVAPALLFLILLTVYPLTRTVQMSFTDLKAGEWIFVGLEHYREALDDKWFWNSVRAVVAFTVPALVLHLLIGLGFALLLNETWFSTGLRNFMRGLLILPWVFSTPASALMWALLLHQTGPVNYVVVGILGQSAPIPFLAGSPRLAMSSLVAINTWLSYPFFMIIILGGLQAIPPELYEAAKVDGANALKRFRHVTLPQLRTILLAVTTIDFIFTFGQLDLVQLLTRGGPLRRTETITYYVYKTGMLDGNLGYGSAVSTLMLLTLLVLIVVYVKLLSRGGESGETSF